MTPSPVRSPGATAGASPTRPSPSTIQLRDFEPGDLPILDDADRSMTAQLLGASGEPYGRDWLWARLDPARIAFRHWRCRVAVDDDRHPVGFAIFFDRRNGCRPPRSSSSRRRPRASFVELFFLWVDERHRRRGIGSALISAVVAYAQRQAAQDVRLHVIDSNPIAVTVYERHQFRKLMLKHDYPSASVRSWRMRRPL